jgi:mono/diheme cytochrome c family protein
MNTRLLLLVLTLCAPTLLYAQWQEGLKITSPRENIFNYPAPQLSQVVMRGRRLALFYPVTVSDLLIPYKPLQTFFDSDPNDPIRRLIFDLGRIASPFKSMGELYHWLGVHPYPSSPQPQTPNPLPVLNEREKSLPMGATLIQTKNGEALTFGCAACHASDLFGVKVLGLTNRFPRANEFFRMGKTYAPYVNSFLFKDILQTTEGERQLLVTAKDATKWVGAKAPAVLGLDTSLAQVALSLARRETDPYATKTEMSHRFPRRNKLETMVADSKPAVWWNVKYKNRWLSDGSIVSGNPVHTNFLWNEIGRGTDLKKLEVWMKESDEQIKALTAAVFATKAPRYEKFFGVHSIDIDKARRGQKHFIKSCQKCHGTYEKGWDLPEAGSLSEVELIQNVKVIYHEQTPVKDVGTDPGRYLGMKEFAKDLNRLAISQAIGALVVPQKGYVPPPLEGIWARWPYFHNNSIPNLCALLTPGKLRPKTYYAGHAKDKQTDFDQECVGYPLGEKTPAHWKHKDYFYDSSQEGLSNLGHDERIFIKDGQEIYTLSEKKELIEFLKTL